MRLLVSVRSGAEVQAALSGGADIIDAKEPLRGPLGPVAPEVLREILEQLPPGKMASAALGDFAEACRIRDSIEALPLTSRVGPVYLKIGFAGTRNPGRVAGLIAAAVAAAEEQRELAPVIAVAYADNEAAATALPEAVAKAAMAAGAAGVLLDTHTKGQGNLFRWMDPARVRNLFREVSQAGLLTAVAGGLGCEQLETVVWTEPDIVGFRGAVCEQGREGQVSQERVERIRRAILESSAFVQSVL